VANSHANDVQEKARDDAPPPPELTRGRPARRGPYAKTVQRREEILDAALMIFAENGYRAGALKEVATVVGLSEAGLIHHFPNKKALLAAVLHRRDQRSVRLVPFDSGAYAALHGLVDLAKDNSQTPGVVRLHCTLSAEATSSEHPAHDYFRSRYSYYVRKLTDAFTRCEELGTLVSDVPPERAARALVALQDGLQLQWLLDPEHVDLPAEIDSAVRRLVDLDRTIALEGSDAAGPPQQADDRRDW
jgi:AcrR family transcriptional regulator